MKFEKLLIGILVILIIICLCGCTKDGIKDNKDVSEYEGSFIDYDSKTLNSKFAFEYFVEDT